MKFFKRHHSHLLVFFLVIAVGVVWTFVLLGPKQAILKENSDLGYVPGQPLNLQAEAISENQVDLTWQTPFVDETNFAPPESYVVYRSLVGDDFDALSPIATRPGSVNSYTDTNVEPGTTYYYKIAGRNINGEGKNSNISTATTLSAVASPEGVVAESVSTTEIKIHWTNNSNILLDGYEIYRKKIDENSFFLAGNVGNVSEFINSNLSPNTTYIYYVIAKKGNYKSKPSVIVEATTLSITAPIDPPVIIPPPDITPPAISQIQIVLDTTSAKVTWQTNELTKGKIIYGETISYGFQKNDENLSAIHSVLLDNLKTETTYHFKIFSTDDAGLTSESNDATFVTLKKSIIIKNVYNVKLSTTTEALVLNWSNPSSEESPNFEGVSVVRKVGSRPESYVDGTLVYRGKNEFFIDKTILLNTSYYYTLFSYTNEGELSGGVSTEEGRINSLKQPNEGCDLAAIDCIKAACKKLAICKKNSSVLLPKSVQSSTVVSKLTIFDIDSLVKKDQLKLTPNQNKIIGFDNEPVKFIIPRNKLPAAATAADLYIGNEPQREFIYDKTRDVYYVDAFFPPKNGLYETKIIIKKEKNLSEEISFLTESVGFAPVVDKNNQKQIEGARIELFDEQGVPVNLSVYEQKNPLITNGTYGWFVPNGTYYINAAKEGYQTSTSSLIVVSNNLISIPLTLSEKNKIFFSTTLENVKQGNLINVENILSKTATPLFLGLVVVLLIIQVPVLNMLALLRLIFLQPILLIGSRKRKAWGEVYNSLSKLPVDLAVVRLINTHTDKLMQSMVTGKNGKYYFRAEEGNYRLEIVKYKMKFPSEILKKYKSDGTKTDLYHGGSFYLKDQYPLVNVNIPGDPEVEIKTPWRLRLEKIGRILQYSFSVSGALLTAYSIYLTPTAVSLWIMFIIHVLVFILFYRLAVPPKPKDWGVVFDTLTKKPLQQTVVRLFNIQFNKLVAMQISDHRGRYYFLAGDSEYQLNFERKEYQSAQSQHIDLRGKEEESIALNMPLKRKST